MEDNDRGVLIGHALLLAVGDMDYVHHATGLFAKEVRNGRARIAAHSDQMAATNPSSFKFSQPLHEVQTDRDFETELVEEIKAYHSKLQQMTADELTAEVEVQREASVARKEAAQLFNQEGHMLVEPWHWARQSVWTPHEAVLLLLGREPSQEIVDVLEKMPDFRVRESGFASGYFDILGIMKTAIEVGEISSPGRPLEYLKWFSKVRFDAPADLVELVRQIHDPDGAPASTIVDLKPNERESLLKLVAGMAIKRYRYDRFAQRSDQENSNRLGHARDRFGQ